MKSLFLAAFAFVSILSSSNVFAEYCPTSAKINAESQLAIDNLEILEEEVNSLYPQSSYIVVGNVNTIKAILQSVNSMSDQSYNTCMNIKAVFYTINFSIFNLSQDLKDIMSQDRQSPLKPFYNTFLSSFIRLEKTIESSPGRYVIPRGPFYRRFFSDFGAVGAMGVCQTVQYPSGSVTVCEDGTQYSTGGLNTWSVTEETVIPGNRRRGRKGKALRSRTERYGRQGVNPRVNPNRNPRMNQNSNPRVNPRSNSRVNPNRNPRINSKRNPNVNP